MADARVLVATAGRFGLVGVACALLNIAIVFIGHDLLDWPYLWAAAATCLVTIPLSYVAHRRFSFGRALQAGGRTGGLTDGRANGWTFGRFMAQQLSQFLLGLLLLIAFVEGLALPPAAAMVAVSLLMFIYGYASNATWVFRVFGPR